MEVTGIITVALEVTGATGSCSTAVYAGAEVDDVMLDRLGEALTLVSVTEATVSSTPVTVGVQGMVAITVRTIAAGDNDGGLP